MVRSTLRNFCRFLQILKFEKKKKKKARKRKKRKKGKEEKEKKKKQKKSSTKLQATLLTDFGEQADEPFVTCGHKEILVQNELNK